MVDGCIDEEIENFLSMQKRNCHLPPFVVSISPAQLIHFKNKIILLIVRCCQPAQGHGDMAKYGIMADVCVDGDIAVDEDGDKDVLMTSLMNVMKNRLPNGCIYDEDNLVKLVCKVSNPTDEGMGKRWMHVCVDITLMPIMSQ